MQNQIRHYSNYSVQLVTGPIDGNSRSKVLEFWHNHAGLSESEAYRRLSELVALAWDKDTLIGLSTAYRTHVDRLGHDLFGYRSFVRAGWRAPGLATRMFVLVKEALQSRSAHDPNPCLGVVVYVPVGQVGAWGHRAVWPGTELMLLGIAADGQQIRVSYFKGARLLNLAISSERNFEND